MKLATGSVFTTRSREDAVVLEMVSLTLLRKADLHTGAPETVILALALVLTLSVRRDSKPFNPGKS